MEKSEADLNKLRAENAKLRDDMKKILQGLEGGKEGQLAEQLMEAKKENKTLTDEVSRLAEELNQLQKETLEKKIQQPGRKSLADELNEESMQNEIDRLKQQLKERENMLTDTQEELKSVKETLGQLQSLLEQKEVEAKVPKTQDYGTQEAQLQTSWIGLFPIPNDKPEKLIDQLKPTQVNTELSDPSLTFVEDPEKSRQ